MIYIVTIFMVAMQYVLGSRAHARITDLSIQTLVDSQSDTKYTPRRSSSVFNPSLYVQDPPFGSSILIPMKIRVNQFILLHTVSQSIQDKHTKRVNFAIEFLISFCYLK